MYDYLEKWKYLPLDRSSYKNNYLGGAISPRCVAPDLADGSIRNVFFFVPRGLRCLVLVYAQNEGFSSRKKKGF
jgi:hypothetical protein